MYRKIQEKIQTMTEEKLAYCVGLFLVAFASVVGLPGYYLELHGLGFFKVFAGVGIVFILYGFWTYLSPGLKKASESLIVKALWAAITIIGAAVSFSLAQLIVNEALKVPSSAFPHTQTIVAVLVSPFVIGLSIFVLGLLLTAPLHLMLHLGSEEFSLKALFGNLSKQAHANGTATEYFARLGAYMLALIVAVATSVFISLHLNGANNFIRWYAFHFETEIYSSCVAASETKVAYLGDDKVISATKKEDTFEFKVVQCSS